MALYDYKCPKCNTIETVQHPIDETPTLLCDVCGTEKRKSYASPAAVFPGGGWGKDAR